MSEANDTCGTAIRNGSAVLMARIVDGSGEAIRRSGIKAVRYSIHELDRRRLDSVAAMPGHDAVALDVGEVVFDSLQTGGLWAMDDVGYNFRHEIDVSRDEPFPKAGRQYQVRYELTPTSGAKTIVRFHLGVYSS